MSEEAAKKSSLNTDSRNRGTVKKRGIQQKEKDRDEETLCSATALPTFSKEEEEENEDESVRDCAYCGKIHDLHDCHLIKRKSVDERLQIAKDKGLCFNCLLPNHYSSNCERPSCSVEGCKKKHHALLHRTYPSTQDKTNSKEKDKKNDNSSDHITSHTGIYKGLLSANSNSQVMLLPSAVVNLVSDDFTLAVRVLVDSGSDQSYIRKEIAESLNLKSNGPLKTMTILMHGGQSRTTKVKNVNFQLSTRDGRQRVNLNAWAVSVVCAPLEPAFIDISKYPHLKELQLAESFPRDEAPIDVLIGADQWSKIIKSGVKKGRKNSPLAMNSRFGWLLSGPTGVEKVVKFPSKTSSCFARTQIIDDDPNIVLKKFWQLESIGIVDDPRELSQDEKYVVQHFQKSVKFDGERYEVELPWKENSPKLVDNRAIAMKRLVNVEKKLNKDPEQARMYRDSINQYIKDGHAREVTAEDDHAEKIHYLPHHPVIRKDRFTTKCRAVFDASAKNQEGISLNDCLLSGPALQPDLVSILIRFRLNRVAMMADVRKMFLQVKVAFKDQNVHRFLWRNLDTRKVVKNYCMTRLPFGDISSPYLAIATMHHHAEMNVTKFPDAVKVIKEDTYVDDCLTGANNEEKAFTLYKDLVNLMQTGGFDLVKWTTNSRELLSRIPISQRVPERIICLDNDLEPLKALGISWDIEEDTFVFHQGNKLLELSDPETKRSLISISSKLFDPLGFLSPYTIRARILYQEVWLSGLAWDVPLTPEIKEQWRRWKMELTVLEEIRVPRFLFNTLTLNVIDTQLHGFSDASPKAYGAVIYLRIQDCMGTVVVHLLMAKTRVAPTKRVTLPKLELMAAYLLSKLIQFVRKSLQINLSQYNCWSDSMITLGWIRRPSYNWKTFVANRVQAIQENIAPEHWRFCPGESNPADLVTRGQSLQDLVHDSVWWHGPDWLRESPEKWPAEELGEGSEDLPESKQRSRSNVAFSRSSLCIQASRFQRWMRLIRITALVFKAVRLFKKTLFDVTVKSDYSMGLTAEHLDEAEKYWCQEIQKEAFPEEWYCFKNKKAIPVKSSLISLAPIFDESLGLIRVGGRLQFADLPEETKHQIILPAKHPVVDKLIAYTHEEKSCHAGPETTLAILRERFWIIHGRRSVQRVIHQCLICRKYRIGPVQQRMAPLPAERVTMAPAFSHVGIDFTGHLILKTAADRKRSEVSHQKAYVCIFSCATTRMVHLELTNDMTTDEFLQAFRRMYNRRGLCHTLWSDNQTTFKKASRDITWLFEMSKQKLCKVWKKIDSSRLQREMASKGIRWKFITERSPHRGGWWERVCRSLKEPLRKVLGKALLTYTEMYTVLTDIEAVINSRPLTFIGTNINDGQIITPAHLALGRSLREVPDVPKEMTSKAPISSRFLYRQNLLNRFWKRWLIEYLPKLTIRQKWRSEKPPLKQGDVVLISEENVKRGNWPLGLVQQVHKGADNLIRTVTLKTKSGIRNRSVQRLYLLEEARSKEDHTQEEPLQEEPIKDTGNLVNQEVEQTDNSSHNLDTLCQGGENVRYYTRFGRAVKPPRN